MVKKNKFLGNIEFKENKGYLAKITGADVDLGHIGIMGAAGGFIGHEGMVLRKMIQQRKSKLPSTNPKTVKGKMLAAVIGAGLGAGSSYLLQKRDVDGRSDKGKKRK